VWPVFSGMGYGLFAITCTATDTLFPPLGIPLFGPSRGSHSHRFQTVCTPIALRYHQPFDSLNPDMFCLVQNFLSQWY
jgi:hypothetical protein